LDIVVAVGALILWLSLLTFQLADLGAQLLDFRRARFSAEKLVDPHIRLSGLFWIFPFIAGLSVALLLGVDFAGHLIFLGAQPVEGAIILLWLVAFSLVVTVAIAFAFTRGSGPSYSSLRARLIDVGTQRVPSAQLEQYRRELADIDAHHNFRRDSPLGLSTIDSVHWATAARFLRGRGWWRLAPAVIGLIPIVSVLFGGSGLITYGGVPLVVLFVVPTPISLLIAVTAARTALAATAAWNAVSQATRMEVEQLLARLDRTSRRGVAGLAERVARALQILREQQG
jgi:hypothetical protein